MPGPAAKISTEKLAVIAGALGIVLFLILLIAGKGFFGALLWAVLVGAAIYVVAMFGFGREIPGMDSASDVPPTGPSARASAPPEQAPPPAMESAGDIGGDPVGTASAPPREPKADLKPKPSAPATAAQGSVKPSAALAGEQDLAARKGAWKYSAAPEDDGTEEEPADIPDVGPAPGTRPEFLHAARTGGADNLKKIKGVGPKLEDLLNEMGIYHFDQIAAWGPDEVAWMDSNLKGFKGRVSRDGWVEQARTLAAGGETAFSAKSGKT